MENPLVLIRNDWYPPKGVSALPVSIQNSVPKDMRYWEEEDSNKREEMLDMLRKSWNGQDFEQPDNVRIAKSNYEKQWIFGVVLSPHEIDSYGDYETPGEIEDAIASYMLNIWKGQNQKLLAVNMKSRLRQYLYNAFKRLLIFGMMDRLTRLNIWFLKVLGFWVYIF